MKKKLLNVTEISNYLLLYKYITHFYQESNSPTKSRRSTSSTSNEIPTVGDIKLRNKVILFVKL